MVFINSFSNSLTINFGVLKYLYVEKQASTFIKNLSVDGNVQLNPPVSKKTPRLANC